MHACAAGLLPLLCTQLLVTFTQRRACSYTSEAYLALVRHIRSIVRPLHASDMALHNCFVVSFSAFKFASVSALISPINFLLVLIRAVAGPWGCIEQRLYQVSRVRFLKMCGHVPLTFISGFCGESEDDHEQTLQVA